MTPKWGWRHWDQELGGWGWCPAGMGGWRGHSWKHAHICGNMKRSKWWCMVLSVHSSQVVTHQKNGEMSEMITATLHLLCSFTEYSAVAAVPCTKSICINGRSHWQCMCGTIFPSMSWPGVKWLFWFIYTMNNSTCTIFRLAIDNIMRHCPVTWPPNQIAVMLIRCWCLHVMYIKGTMAVDVDQVTKVVKQKEAIMSLLGRECLSTAG